MNDNFQNVLAEELTIARMVRATIGVNLEDRRACALAFVNAGLTDKEIITLEARAMDVARARLRVFPQPIVTKEFV